VPEEVNRRVIDQCSTVLLPYTHRSKENLLREGFPGERLYVTGNPIKQVIDHYRPRIDSSDILDRLELNPRSYFLVTMHRAENVDDEARLRILVEVLIRLHLRYGHRVVCSFHPRTRSKVERFGVDISRQGLRFEEPFGFFDFVKLEQNAFCCLSDSGTVQEEACLSGIPNVTIRDVTERPETLECGSNILTGVDPDAVIAAVNLVTQHRVAWTPPSEYLEMHVAETVSRIVTGFRLPDRAEEGWRKRKEGETQKR
jgi:UDP-N-acetylglucosamine 2-epimerase (non-hydrolysing)